MNAETFGRIRPLMTCVAVSIGAVLTGCAAPTVQYYPDAEQAIEDEVGSAPPPGSAVVEFTTNSVAIAVFQRRVGDKLCEPESEDIAARVRRREMLSASVQRFHGLANFMSLGNLNRIEKLPRTKITHYPAGQAIAFAATTYINDASCGPLFLRFTPEEGKHYSLSTDLQDHICRLSIQELVETEQARPVKHSRWWCSKPFLGIGKPRLIGPDEIN
ncbi:hypothetical protein [Hydrogenophaga borbori]|nr:hypothetical protein [Hydrogenophaga borbori]